MEETDTTTTTALEVFGKDLEEEESQSWFMLGFEDTQK